MSCNLPFFPPKSSFLSEYSIFLLHLTFRSPFDVYCSELYMKRHLWGIPLFYLSFCLFFSFLLECGIDFHSCIWTSGTCGSLPFHMLSNLSFKELFLFQKLAKRLCFATLGSFARVRCQLQGCLLMSYFTSFRWCSSTALKQESNTELRMVGGRNIILWKP